VDVAGLAARLARAGFVAAQDEARELMAAAVHAEPDARVLDGLVARRLAGEPLAWIVGHTVFDGIDVQIDPGVYVPRWQSTELARRAVARLPATGTAVDLCTGSGAIALVLLRGRPRARVLATDADEKAVACARANGVHALRGDLFAPLPRALMGAVDVVVAVVPYVPTPALGLLPRDTFSFESPVHYDGGPDGTGSLRRVATGAPRFLRPGGSLLLELGAAQPDALGDLLGRLGYEDVETWADEDGDVRGLQATWASPRGPAPRPGPAGR
jgi:release factor glutamine methyltransferase